MRTFSCRTSCLRVFLLCACVLIAGCSCAPRTHSNSAPDFQLADLSGQRFYLSAHRGEIVLLNFWSVYCVPCIREMPHLQRIWEQYRDKGVVVVGVCTDVGQEGALEAYLGKCQVTYPVLVDNGVVQRQYHVNALPSTHIVDRDGRIHRTVTGYAPGYETQYVAAIDSLLEAR